MAFEAFNFGKRLGLIANGHDAPPKMPPVSTSIETELPDGASPWDFPISRGGGYWTRGLKTFWAGGEGIGVDDNPLESFPVRRTPRRSMTYEDWTWNEGPDTGDLDPLDVTGVGSFDPGTGASLNNRDPRWGGKNLTGWQGCDLDNPNSFPDCPEEFRKQVESIMNEIKNDLNLQNKFPIEWHCIINATFRLGCCGFKPLPNPNYPAFDDLWVDEILKKSTDGIVWLSPSLQPIKLYILRAMLQLCEPINSSKSIRSSTELIAYAMAGLKPPCKLLRRLYNESKMTGSLVVMDKFVTWDPGTGEVWHHDDYGARSELVEGVNWDCNFHFSPRMWSGCNVDKQVIVRDALDSIIDIGNLEEIPGNLIDCLRNTMANIHIVCNPNQLGISEGESGEMIVGRLITGDSSHPSTYPEGDPRNERNYQSARMILDFLLKKCGVDPVNDIRYWIVMNEQPSLTALYFTIWGQYNEYRKAFVSGPRGSEAGPLSLEDFLKLFLSGDVIELGPNVVWDRKSKRMKYRRLINTPTGDVYEEFEIDVDWWLPNAREILKYFEQKGPDSDDSGGRF